MTLIDTAEFRTRFDISPDVTDARLTPHIGSASRRLRRWVSDAVYDQAVLDVDTDVKNDLQNAEAYLAFHFALLGLHFNLSSKGVLVEAQAGEGTERRRYLLPDQIAALSTQMLEIAREIAEPWTNLDQVPESSWLPERDC